MADTYSVVLTGKLAEGRTLEQVKANVGKLFKLETAQIDKLLCGKPMGVRRGISREQADKICKALTKAGAVAAVKADRPLAQAETGSASSANKAAPARRKPAQAGQAKAKTAPADADAAQPAPRREAEAAATGGESFTPDLECPRCGHQQAFAKACKQCKMDLTLHIQRLKRREKVRANRRKATG